MFINFKELERQTDSHSLYEICFIIPTEQSSKEKARSISRPLTCYGLIFRCQKEMSGFEIEEAESLKSGIKYSFKAVSAKTPDEILEELFDVYEEEITRDEWFRSYTEELLEYGSVWVTTLPASYS